MTKEEFFAVNFKKSTKSYRNIQARIQRLYNKYGSDVDYKDLYIGFQRVNEKVYTDMYKKCYKIRDDFEKIQCGSTDTGKMQHVSTEIDDHWIYINKHPVKSMDLIKVYATPADPTKLVDIYKGALSLLMKSKNGFGSKASRIKRSDPLCFWVEREDFFELEKYFQQFELKHAIPFIPYRGNIGISRETIDSYNCSLSQLLTLYFAKKPTKVSLIDIYRFLVDILDMEFDINYSSLYEPHTTIVLLKSMEIIVNEEEISDDHMLLWKIGALRDSVRQFDRW